MCISINRKTLKEHERDREERNGRGKRKGEKLSPSFPNKLSIVTCHLLPDLASSFFCLLISYFPQNSTSTPLHDKNTQQTRKEGNFLNLINNIYENPIASTTVNSGRKNAFLPRPETRQEYLLLTLLFNKGPKGLAKAVKQENKIKCIQSGKEVKLIYR